MCDRSIFRSQLDRQLKTTNVAISKAKESLRVYESVGSSFEQLVEKYTQITMEIDNKKWALTELQKTKGT